jgi:hypothetical protein
MLEAAADAVAELSDAMTLGAALLPPVENLHMVSAAVDIAVAVAAEKEGLAQVELSSPVQQVHQAMWWPVGGLSTTPWPRSVARPGCRSEPLGRWRCQWWWKLRAGQEWSRWCWRR